MTALKLGKLPAQIDKRTIRLSSIIRRELLPPLPDAYNVDTAIGGIDDIRMFANDTYGCCVIAARAHHTFRFEKFEQGEQIDITDQEVIDQYFKETGGADKGLYLLGSMKRWRSEGWPVGIRNYNTYAFASVDWQDETEVKHCIHLLGGVNLGMLVFQEDMAQFRRGADWHLTSDPGNFQGGHGIYIFQYNDYGLTCMTWGKAQCMTWAFFRARIDEAYGIVDNRNEWMGVSSPVDVEKLDAYLKEISGNGAKPGCSLWPVAIIKQILRR